MDYIYIPPTLTVDCVLFQLINNRLHVLLIQRASEPFKGEWALPGGYNAAGDTTHDALARVLRGKVGIELTDLALLQQLYTFDTVARDPRGPAVSVSYMGLVQGLEWQPPETAQNPTFFAVDDLPHLAYDHADIVHYAHERLQARISYTTTVSALLPKRFTLTQLQTAYEAILGRSLDKRNFRKKYLALDVLKPTTRYFQDGAHRPALLYQFAKTDIQPLLREF